MPLAAVFAWPAQEAGKGFCRQAGVGKVSQDLDSYDKPMRARSPSLTWARKRPQPKALGCNRAQAGAMACIQVVGLWNRSAGRTG